MMTIIIMTTTTTTMMINSKFKKKKAEYISLPNFCCSEINCDWLFFCHLQVCTNGYEAENMQGRAEV